MKNVVQIIVVAFAISMAYTVVNAQKVYVVIRPARPAVLVQRPPARSSKAVWVDEDWLPQADTYIWHGNYWAISPRARSVYIKGYWTRTKKGHNWTAGRWR